MLAQILVPKQTIGAVLTFLAGVVAGIVASTHPRPPGAPLPLYMRDDSD